MIAGDPEAADGGRVEDGIPVRVEPGGRAVLRLGRWGYSLRAGRAQGAAGAAERVMTVLGTGSLVLFGLGWIPVVWLQATGGEPAGLHLAPIGISLAGLLATGLYFGWREIAGELLGYFLVLLLVVLLPLYFPLLAFPAVRRRLGAAFSSDSSEEEAGAARRRRRNAPVEGEAAHLYDRLAGARLTGTGRRATLELEHRDGTVLTCTASGRRAEALREAARDRLDGLLTEGRPGPPPV